MAGAAPPFDRSVLTNLQWWARSFRGVVDRYPVMASPPAMSVSSGAASTINGAYTAGGVLYNANSTSLTYAHTTPIISAFPTARAGHITSLDGTNNVSNVPWSVRFITDAPVFEAAFFSTNGVLLNAIIDGQYANRDGVGVPVLDNSGVARYVKFDFGAETASFYLSDVAKVSGGTGYAIGDTITLAGGTATTPVVLKVAQVSAGAVSLAVVQTPGVYSAISTSAGGLTQASTSGGGSGATFTGATWSKRYVARKFRRIELVFSGGISGTFGFAGLVTAAQDKVLPWPLPTRAPRGVILGDSQSAGTYLQYGGGHMGASIAQQLGLWDRLEINAVGGTGFTVDNGNGGRFFSTNRVANVLAWSPDYLVIIGSQNDSGVASATLRTAVTAGLTSIQTARPDLPIVIIGPVVGGYTSYMTDLAAAIAAAPVPGNIRLIDNSAETWFAGTGSVASPSGSGNFDYYLTSGNHLTQAGVDGFATLAAPRIAAALLDIVGTP